MPLRLLTTSLYKKRGREILVRFLRGVVLSCETWPSEKTRENHWTERGVQVKRRIGGEGAPGKGTAGRPKRRHDATLRHWLSKNRRTKNKVKR